MTSFFDDVRQYTEDVTVCDFGIFRKMMVPFAETCFVVSHYLCAKENPASDFGLDINDSGSKGANKVICSSGAVQECEASAFRAFLRVVRSYG
jgi:hypothetical protein